MTHNIRDILIEILTIIGYEGNKEKFANGLLDVIHQEAIVNVINTLPQEHRDRLKEQLIQSVSPEMEKTLLLKYITPDIYLSELKATTEKVFQNYLNTIMPTITDHQRTALASYLQSLRLSIAHQEKDEESPLTE